MKQRCSSGTVATGPVLPKKQRPFASKCFFHEQRSLDLARLRRSTRTVVLFRSHMHKFMIRHLWRSYKRLLKHRVSIFSTFLYINRHESIFIGKTAVFEQRSLTSSSSGRRPELNSLHQFCYRMMPHRHTMILVHQCKLVLIIHVESCEKLSQENVQELIPVFYQIHFFNSL